LIGGGLRRDPAQLAHGVADRRRLGARVDEVGCIARDAGIGGGPIAADERQAKGGEHGRIGRLSRGITAALREIGRIERTLFMLDWLELPGLRRQATVELNKGEPSNALARAVGFHRLGRLRDRAVEAQQYRASGLALVTAAIALWNTVYLDRALDDLRYGSEMIPKRCLPALLPSAGSTSISPAIICGMSMSAWLRTGSERSARQQQAFARPLPPDRVPDPVLLTVLSCPFYGVTPT
jgi:hypothetical protein